jgi:hypothetical protein
VNDAADTQQIGEVAPWMVKDFSVQIRKHITDQARRQGCTVADWLHAYFHKHGLDGVEINPVKITEVKPLAPHVADLVQLVQEARTMAQAAGLPVSPTLAREVTSLARQAVRAARGLPPAPPRSTAKLIAGGQ